MTKAITRAIIDDRWRMATTETLLDDCSPANPYHGNSKPMRQLMTSLELLAGHMIEDGTYTVEQAAWGSLQYDLLTTIEEKIKVYALRVETERAGRQGEVAS